MPITIPLNAQIEAFFDPVTYTVSYVVADTTTKRAAIIDPVLDYDFKSGRTGTRSLDAMVRYLEMHGLSVDWILETHAHADHLSGAHVLRARVGGKIAIGEQVREVQSAFKALYNLDDTFVPNGAQFDHLFKDGEQFLIGGLQVTALHVPGHTPADLAYRVDNAVFVGDTLFMPDVGTARADFPGADPRRLYRSIRRLLDLPEDTVIYVCHDYPPGAPPVREPRWRTTVAAQRAGNIHVRDGISEDDFVAMRTARDRTLDMPTLILPSLQVNIRAGAMPAPEANGRRYLKIPLDAV